MDMTSYILGKKAGGGSSQGLKVVVVEELPETGDTDKLYLVPKQDTSDNDIFEEWIYVDNNWEKIGTTDFEIPIASASTLGGIKVGDGLDIDVNGVLSTSVNFTKVYINSSGATISFMDIWDNNTTIKTLINIGWYYIFDSYSSKKNYPIAIMCVRKSGSQTIQHLFIFAHENRKDFIYAVRTIGENGYISTSGKFQNNEIDFYAGNNPANIEMSNINNLPRVKDMIAFFGDKTISDLQTTNKSSLVDAINEINTNVGNINTVLATLTTPSSNVSL